MANENLKGKKVAILERMALSKLNYCNRAKLWTKPALKPKLCR
jgi:hypothetical protein